MARAQKLKVYRTPIGFHDAYVAAPSQKAALAAWGSDRNLFAQGSAELVEDPALTTEPLASPGKVIKRLRGTTAEQLAALPADKPKPAAKRTPAAAPVKPAPPPAPRPSRAALDEAERALDAARRAHDAEKSELAEREAGLARERKALETQADEEEARLKQAIEEANSAYEAAMKRWRG